MVTRASMRSSPLSTSSFVPIVTRGPPASVVDDVDCCIGVQPTCGATRAALSGEHPADSPRFVAR
eukprot:5608545-Prymnesium_polylepis.1